MNLYKTESEYIQESARIHPMENQPAYSNQISICQVVVDLKESIKALQLQAATLLSTINSLQVLALSLSEQE